jgi:outer membrane protein
MFRFTFNFVRFGLKSFAHKEKSINLPLKLTDMHRLSKTKESNHISVKPLHIILFLAILLTARQVTAQGGISEKFSLDQCIEMGLKNNPGFQSSEFLLDETKAKMEEAFSGYYPVISINSDADTYSKENGSRKYNNFNTGVTLSYNIFQGYKTKSLYGAAQDNYQANLYQHKANRQDLVFNIIWAYYRTLQSERILQSADEAVKNSNLHLEFAVAKKKAGMATRSDILRTEVELSSAELDKIKATNILLAAKGNLNQFLGLPSDYQIEIQDDLSIINEVPVQSYNSLLNEAINSRSEIKKYQSHLDAQNKNILIAKSGYYPSLRANANYNFAGPAVTSTQQNLWLGMSLSVPVFKGFFNKARVNQEEFAFKSLEKDLEQLKQQISQEVWNAWLSVKESVERISTSSKAVESARENLSLAEGEYKEGVGSIIQLTDAQTTFVTVEQNYIQALADFKISYAKLERTIGK